MNVYILYVWSVRYELVRWKQRHSLIKILIMNLESLSSRSNFVSAAAWSRMNGGVQRFTLRIPKP